MNHKTLLLLIILVPLWWGCEKEDIPDNGDDNGNEDTSIDWQAAADQSSNSLTSNFWNSSGKYFNTDNGTNTNFQYWPNGHALDVLVDAYERTGNPTYKTFIEDWFVGVKARNGNTWDNEYYDDMEWNAIALLRAYKATNDTKYKDAVLELWGYIKQGWNDNAGGGIAWRKAHPWSKNACSNGPAAILAARLYQEFGDEEDKQWAINIYNWQKSTLVNLNTGAVWDNINSNTGEIQKDWIFTYNQGTYIGAAVELHKIFNEISYLNDAVLAANYTMSSLIESSIIKSEGTGDGGLFKGIFIRYFTQLILQERLKQTDFRRYIQFITFNAETLWNDGRYKPATLFSPNWRESPGSVTGLTEQLSGCMLIEAMALLDNEGKLE